MNKSKMIQVFILCIYVFGASKRNFTWVLAFELTFHCELNNYREFILCNAGMVFIVLVGFTGKLYWSMWLGMIKDGK